MINLEKGTFFRRTFYPFMIRLFSTRKYLMVIVFFRAFVIGILCLALACPVWDLVSYSVTSIDIQITFFLTGS